MAWRCVSQLGVRFVGFVEAASSDRALQRTQKPDAHAQNINQRFIQRGRATEKQNRLQMSRGFFRVRTLIIRVVLRFKDSSG